MKFILTVDISNNIPDTLLYEKYNPTVSWRKWIHWATSLPASAESWRFGDIGIIARPGFE